MWWKGWKGMGVISGSCRAGNGYTDRVSSTVSVPHLVGGLELVPTAVGSDEGPATGANSVSRRSIVRFRPCYNPWSFRVDIRAYNYLRSTGRD